MQRPSHETIAKRSKGPERAGKRHGRIATDRWSPTLFSYPCPQSLASGRQVADLREGTAKSGLLWPAPTHDAEYAMAKRTWGGIMPTSPSRMPPRPVCPGHKVQRNMVQGLRFRIHDLHFPVRSFLFIPNHPIQASVSVFLGWLRSSP